MGGLIVIPMLTFTFSYGEQFIVEFVGVRGEDF